MFQTQCLSLESYIHGFKPIKDFWFKLPTFYTRTLSVFSDMHLWKAHPWQIKWISPQKIQNQIGHISKYRKDSSQDATAVWARKKNLKAENLNPFEKLKSWQFESIWIHLKSLKADNLNPFEKLKRIQFEPTRDQNAQVASPAPALPWWPHLKMHC